MAAMLSSPLVSAATMTSHPLRGTTAAVSRYDPFEQPNSPTLKHADLPAEFGDHSFGSSMSLGSSFELSRIANSVSAKHVYQARASSTIVVESSSSSSTSTPSSLHNHPSIKRSPNRGAQDSLGAAMGTLLNSKSPGLAAKMNSSPHYMDMSPMPSSKEQKQATNTGIMTASSSFQETPLRRPTRSATMTKSELGAADDEEEEDEENLPPGSAMKEDTSVGAIRSSTRDGINTFPRCHSEATATTALVQGGGGGGSLGRLFGTELFMHASKTGLRSTAGTRASVGCVFGGHGVPIGSMTDSGEESFSSPDKEPPAKRRPASLPVSQTYAQQRPSLRSAGMGPPSAGAKTITSNVTSAASAARSRPSLLKSMTTPAEECKPSSSNRRSDLEHLRQQYRTSDSVVPTLGRPSRSRAGSMERSSMLSGGLPTMHGECESRSTQKSSLPPPMHPTIIESPSPSKAGDELAGYFFDPQSPEMQRGAHLAGTQSTAFASHSSNEQNPSISSVVSQSQGFVRPRGMEKAASSAVVPSMAVSLLGKRSNPYAKRTLGGLTSAAQTLHSQEASSSSSRLKVPAPRRCQSALDNSAAFQLAGAAMVNANAAGEDMSLSSGGDGSFALGCVADFSTDDASPSMLRSAAVRQQHPVRLPPGFDASGSPIAPSSRSSARPDLFRRPSKDDSSPLGYGKRFTAQTAVMGHGDPLVASPCAGVDTLSNAGILSMPRSPSDQHMPGFGASEREGKILPCYSVKDDGLMRITADTLVSLMNGAFDAQSDGFQIVDCRFGYEFDGGHIPGAINLSTMDKVKRHFLEPNEINKSALPCRSQSGKADRNGKVRKKIIVFHCEFSLKRGPSSALALRQADRALAHDYPNCHYPEVYVLQGGYCGFFKQFAAMCQPQAYVEMDDPRFQQRRSVELNGFRKQFSRHRSFAYGDHARQVHSDGSLVAAAVVQQRVGDGNAVRAKSGLSRAIQEEDSSFDNSASSPSTMQAEAVLARRRGLTRYATASNVLPPTGANVLASDPTLNRRAPVDRTSLFAGVRPALKEVAPGAQAPTCVGDLSFGSCCSIGDEESI